MADAPRKPHVIAVTGGKGGVGKTSLAVNLAICLRMFDVDVLLLDADFGLANIDVLLGLDVWHNLRDAVINGWPIENVVVDGPRGLKILPGASGVEEMVRLGNGKLEKFLSDLSVYCADMDYVVIDTAPGIEPQVIDCLLAADQMLVITNPEPTALTDAYAMLKVLSRRPESRERTISVIMNQIGSKEEALQSFDRLRGAVKRFLKMEIEYMGSVAWDEVVGEATKRQVAFLTHYAGSPCSRDVRKIAARLVSASRGGSGDVGRFFRSIAEGGAGE